MTGRLEGLPPKLCEWCGDRPRVVGSVYCSPDCEEQDRLFVNNLWRCHSDGREICAPCRGYSDYCAPLRCHSSILDDLLWTLWGWLWVLGGAATPGAWLGDLRWQCEGCHGWQDPDHGCADDAPELCDDCWAEQQGVEL